MKFKPPQPETLTAKDGPCGACVYSWLPSDTIFFPCVRILMPNTHPGRRSFWLAWHIEAGRFVRTSVAVHIPKEVLAWAAACLLEEYPDVASNCGYTAAEIEEARGQEARAKSNRAEKRGA